MQRGTQPRSALTADKQPVSPPAPQTHQHHVIPQAFRQRLRGVVDPDDYVVEIPVKHHQGIHQGEGLGGEYNRDWDEWLKGFGEEGRTPTKEEVEDFAGMVKEKYGIEGEYKRYRK